MRRFVTYLALFIAAVAWLGSKNDEPAASAPTSSKYDVTTALPEQSPYPSIEPTPAPTETEIQRKPVEALKYVRGNRVALREGPGKHFGILDRYDAGRDVILLETRNDWSHIKDRLTLKEGWLASRYLSAENNQSEAEKPKPKQAEQPFQPKAPAISDSVVIQRIIAESVASYPSSCACPYSRDRGGRRCGKRSAYSKPGGYSPICFKEDVTSAMIEAFRQR